MNATSPRRRFALCGVSHRGLSAFVRPILELHAARAEMVALLDDDSGRFDVAARELPLLSNVPRYAPSDMARMARDCRPDAVIVAGADFTHADHVVAALAEGLDVIVEKPMTTTVEDSRRILAAEKNSSGRVKVAFNVRHAPLHRAVARLVREGHIGRVVLVDFQFSVDIHHGSSYFRRWHRRKHFSGGLANHKSSHHFDLVGFWLDDCLDEVFAYGARNYFGADSPWRPESPIGQHCGNCDAIGRCAYGRATALRRRVDDGISGDRVVNAYRHYRPDACVFDQEIDVEDTLTVLARFQKSAMLTYSISFSAPYEGKRVVLTGTHGRIEIERIYAPERAGLLPKQPTIELYPLFGERQTITVHGPTAGHDGSDTRLLTELLFGPSPGESLKTLAGAAEGARMVAVAAAIDQSIREKRPVRVNELLGEDQGEVHARH